MDALTLDGLLELERRGWDSLCEGRGGTFYGELVTDDALMVLVNGMVMDAPTVRASLDGAPAWSSFEISEPRLVAAGDGAAALVYRARAQRDGDEPFEALMTSVYAAGEDGPRLVLYTQTTTTH